MLKRLHRVIALLSMLSGVHVYAAEFEQIAKSLAEISEQFSKLGQKAQNDSVTMDAGFISTAPFDTYKINRKANADNKIIIRDGKWKKGESVNGIVDRISELYIEMDKLEHVKHKINNIEDKQSMEYKNRMRALQHDIGGINQTMVEFTAKWKPELDAAGFNWNWK